jgi:hypothetical protein
MAPTTSYAVESKKGRWIELRFSAGLPRRKCTPPQHTKECMESKETSFLASLEQSPSESRFAATLAPPHRRGAPRRLLPKLRDTWNNEKQVDVARQSNSLWHAPTVEQLFLAKPLKYGLLLAEHLFE